MINEVTEKYKEPYSAENSISHSSSLEELNRRKNRLRVIIKKRFREESSVQTEKIDLMPKLLKSFIGREPVSQEINSNNSGDKTHESLDWLFTRQIDPNNASSENVYNSNQENPKINFEGEKTHTEINFDDELDLELQKALYDDDELDLELQKALYSENAKVGKESEKPLIDTSHKDQFELHSALPELEPLAENFCMPTISYFTRLSKGSNYDLTSVEGFDTINDKLNTAKIIYAIAKEIFIRFTNPSKFSVLKMQVDLVNLNEDKQLEFRLYEFWVYSSKLEKSRKSKSELTDCEKLLNSSTSIALDLQPGSSKYIALKIATGVDSLKRAAKKPTAQLLIKSLNPLSNEIVDMRQVELIRRGHKFPSDNKGVKVSEIYTKPAEVHIYNPNVVLSDVETIYAKMLLKEKNMKKNVVAISANIVK